MRLRMLVLAALVTVAASCASLGPPYPEFINVTEPWPYPFSSAVRSGPYLFLSGQIGTKLVDGKPVLVSGGIEPETKQTFENIKAILEAAGSSMDKVVKCNVYLRDINDFAAMNEVYKAYFTTPFPARTTIQAGALPRGFAVEIECVAKAK